MAYRAYVGVTRARRRVAAADGGMAAASYVMLCAKACARISWQAAISCNNNIIVTVKQQIEKKAYAAA